MSKRNNSKFGKKLGYRLDDFLKQKGQQPSAKIALLTKFKNKRADARCFVVDGSMGGVVAQIQNIQHAKNT